MLDKRIRQRRQVVGMTQPELAEKVHTTKQAISHYENSRSTPSKEMLILLANALETSTDYLLGLTEDPTPSHSEKQMDLTVLEKLAKQSPSIRRYVNNYKIGAIGYIQLLEGSLSDLATVREKQSV